MGLCSKPESTIYFDEFDRPLPGYIVVDFYPHRLFLASRNVLVGNGKFNRAAQTSNVMLSCS
jgi:hypothetical protein